MRINFWPLAHFSLISFLFFSLAGFTAEVSKVKGKSVLIKLEGEPAQSGDEYFLLNSSGKKRALIRIAKVKGDRAIGKVTKGKAQAGMILQHRQEKSASAGRANQRSSSTSSSDSKMYWGGVIGISQNSMDVVVKDTNNNTVGTSSMSGMSFSAKGLFDFAILDEMLWFRGLAGLQGFSASGSSICGVGNSQTCNAELYYLTADFLGRWVFMPDSFRPWIGGGLGLMFPASKDSSALDSSSIGTTSAYIAALGVDWFMSPQFMIPIQLEYNMLPKSDEVEASFIALRAGFAVPF